MIIEEVKTVSGTYEETVSLDGVMLNTNSVQAIYYDDDYKWIEIPPDNYSVLSVSSIQFVEYEPPSGRIKIVYVPDMTGSSSATGGVLDEIATDVDTIAGSINSSSQQEVSIAASDIMVPADIQAVLKTSLGSTTTALDASGTWTGSTFDASTYTKVIGYAFSDVDGTAYVEHSMDGTNWDVSESFTVTGGSATTISATAVAKYVRIRYVNGAAAQTEFRFECFAVVLL